MSWVKGDIKGISLKSGEGIYCIVNESTGDELRLKNGDEALVDGSSVEKILRVLNKKKPHTRDELDLLSRFW